MPAANATNPPTNPLTPRDQVLPKDAAQGLYEFRKKWAAYRPYALCKVRNVETLHEFISWPWLETDGRVMINVRPVEQPGALMTLECRKQVSPVRWSALRCKAYKEGFKAGIAYAVAEARKYNQGRA